MENSFKHHHRYPGLSSKFCIMWGLVNNVSILLMPHEEHYELSIKADTLVYMFKLMTEMTFISFCFVFAWIPSQMYEIWDLWMSLYNVVYLCLSSLASTWLPGAITFDWHILTLISSVITVQILFFLASNITFRVSNNLCCFLFPDVEQYWIDYIYIVSHIFLLHAIRDNYY